ncbi:integrase [Ralstonia pseudosolanacearum]|uniref:integrase n=1 Tax=Ralstonia pseudosolanacearum TaxID=1310165 RepID=UPI002006CA49|nr:integrase [Ralstonia pseudosolanacearum]
MSSLNPVAQGLRAYKEFLDESGLQWDDFSAVDKYLRPTYHYRTHVQGLINSGALKDSTASSRMHAVVGFYRFLMEDERLGFHPQNAPWADRTIGLAYRDSKGFKQIKEVTTTDLSIKVPKRDYAWDGRIKDGGKLRPLSRHEQKTLVEALKQLGNRDYELMHYTALLTGARIQTVLTLRWGNFATPPSQINQWPFKLQCGPGTGIDTKGDVPDVYLSVQKDLYEWLHIYAVSDRARSRREKSNRKQDPTNYLFLSSQGGPHYESKADRNALWDSAEPPLKRSSPAGQNLRSFITDYVIHEIRKTIPDFHYQFHDLRATFGVNWVDAVTESQDTRQRYLWARDQLRKLMWHKKPTTTDLYIDYRQNIQLLEKAEADWNRNLLDLIHSA